MNTISPQKQHKVYAKTKAIRHILNDIQALRNIVLVGKINVPYVKKQIDHLKYVKGMEFNTYIHEMDKLDILYVKLNKIKEKMLSYYD